MNTIVFLFYSLISRKKQGHKSEVAPSQFHRSSIETMEYRWTIDGLSSKEERRQMPGMMGDFPCYVRQTIMQEALKLEGLNGRNNAVLS